LTLINFIHLYQEKYNKPEWNADRFEKVYEKVTWDLSLDIAGIEASQLNITIGGCAWLLPALAEAYGTKMHIWCEDARLFALFRPI
jgi:hypothetical protein